MAGFVAWWQFDEGQGYETDSSGNGHNVWLDSPTLELNFLERSEMLLIWQMAIQMS